VTTVQAARSPLRPDLASRKRFTCGFWASFNSGVAPCQRDLGIAHKEPVGAQAAHAGCNAQMIA